MSVVAVKVNKDSIVIGSDSIIVKGYTQEKDKLAKLWRIDEDIILGAVGLCEESFLFKQFLSTHKPKESTEDRLLELWAEFVGWSKSMKSDSNSKVDNSEFIIVVNNRVFNIDNFFVREVNDYLAIGAGANYALSALYLGSSVEKAIEISCELSIYCEKPINLIEVKKHEG